MMPTACLLLDDYLANDLAGEELLRFNAHLAGCPECQQIVYDHARLDSFLRAAITNLEPIPRGLTDRVARRLRASRRRRIAVVAAAAAAAVTLIWAVGRFAPSTDQSSPIEQVVEGPEAPVPELAAPDKKVRVTFTNRNGVLALSEESASPNVTFIRVYPGLRELSQSEQIKETEVSPEERNEP
jgi:hypothetical protein